MDWTRVTPFQTSWQGLYHARTEGSSEPNQPFAKISAAACAAHRQDSATSATFRVASATKNPLRNESDRHGQRQESRNDTCTQILLSVDHVAERIEILRKSGSPTQDLQRLVGVVTWTRPGMMSG